MRQILRSTGTIRYVPKGDRALPTSEQTAITFTPLTQAERLIAFDSLSIIEVQRDGAAITRSQSWQQARELCASKIVTVENFPVGNPVPWPATAKERDTYLEGFDEFVLLELGAAIRDASRMPDPAGN